MKKRTLIKIAGVVIAGTLGIAAYVGSREEYKLDDDNEYIHTRSAISRVKDEKKGSMYTRYIKRALDFALSVSGLIIFSPLFVLLSAVIFIDDPGPVIFKQKRVGKNCKFFFCHKVRSMKMSTPHDVPTHQLDNPEEYITRVGRVLRRTSMDELPQIWDILRGKMSVIGPRPALWNQDDLVEERDKYCANDVMPGLTGLAQINGRDELEISDKARIDGEYVQALTNGVLKAVVMDIKCFFGTVASVLRHDGVVEGGTGELHKNLRPGVPKFDPESVLGCDQKISIDGNRKVNVLVTGVGSYIGESFKKYCMEHYHSNFHIDMLDMQNPSWRNHNLRTLDGRPYDTVFHVAGIAHADVGNVNEATKEKYYQVNTDLAVECCQKAKYAGVKQFIFISSMIIYGKIECIDRTTVPHPTNFYGDSKWQADKGVRVLEGEGFHVAVLRLPMIYGESSKGNYPTLAKIARKALFFPNYNNTRSMLYIENLCEFVSLLILSGQGGIYFPQNSTYIKTTEMVKAIAAVNGSGMREMSILNPAVSIARRVPGKIGNLAEKAFGSSYFSEELSRYDGLDYQVVGLEESIERTEGSKKKFFSRGKKFTEDVSKKELVHTHKQRVLILVNHEVVIYNFRLELVERLLADGYEVHISTPIGERVEKLKAMGAIIHDISFDRHGMNPLDDLFILRHYRKLVRDVKPVIVLSYTIKPNIYGAMASRMSDVPFVANITGLGTAVENGGVRQKLIIALYKVAFGGKKGKIQRVFFQNRMNEEFFRNAGIAMNIHFLLPGSGVNTERFPYKPYPPCRDGKSGESIKFAFISRIMVEKGIDMYLDLAEAVKVEYPNTEFHICGFFEPEYDRSRLDRLCKADIVSYDGNIEDVAEFIGSVHCIVHPTYYPEGLSNVLLEASSCGRPVITTDRAGCREVVEDNGFLVPEKDIWALINALKKFIELKFETKEQMGKAGRKLVEEKFSRDIVVNAYMDEVRRVKQL